MQIPEIVAHQWAITTEVLLDDLERLGEGRVQAIDYGTFLGSPQPEMERLAAAVGLGWDRKLGDTLPLSKTTVSKPDRQKWRRLAHVIEVGLADRRASRMHAPGNSSLTGASRSARPLTSPAWRFL